MEERETGDKADRTTAALPKGQVALIIGLNALISLVISLGVVIVAGSGLKGFDSGTPTAPPTLTTLPQSSPPTLPLVEGATPPAEQPPPATPPGPSYYTVQPGDTLSSIAFDFGITLEALMGANGLTDEDYIQIGQELLIPLAGDAEPTATYTPVPVLTDTPLPSEPPTPLPSGAPTPLEPAVMISPTPTVIPTSTAVPRSALRVGVTGVLSPGEASQEMVEILNSGPGVNLEGWQLSSPGGKTYTFPNLFLWGGGSVLLHTTSGANSATDLYWGLSGPVWSSGIMVTLKDAQGNVISTYTVP